MLSCISALVVNGTMTNGTFACLGPAFTYAMTKILLRGVKGLTYETPALKNLSYATRVQVIRAVGKL
jgi:hypothetical protein